MPYIGCDLCDERLRRLEFLFGAEEVSESDRDLLVIKLPGRGEEVNLKEGTAILLESGSDAEISNSWMVYTCALEHAGIDAEGRKGIVGDIEVKGWKADLSAFAAPLGGPRDKGKRATKQALCFV